MKDTETASRGRAVTADDSVTLCIYGESDAPMFFDDDEYAELVKEAGIDETDGSSGFEDYYDFKFTTPARINGVEGVLCFRF